MSRTIAERLAELGINLPTPAKPVASYVGYVQVGNLLVTSGQLPLKEGKLVSTGLLGRDLSIQDGQDAAKWCAVNILAQANNALGGNLDRIVRIVKITVFVAGSSEFNEHHLVANGASDFLVEVLGAKGTHARSAVGVSSLPMNAPVEIEAQIEVT
ncbi:RidA family protein [Pseudomonas aeruginosa]|nr:RidA family protein [Pseudomonas aeruginosa]MCS8829168.1 RidA family protein [Pseudomonas aeruginosa]MCS8874011.1 RidA family protein [Pseudomonas aeruginosa]MCS8907991.1 RidA family protein [Pseudomonas aeruginosa]MCS8914042.1 RidA family protein [Pseudomonas aeruginosa]